MKGRATFEFIPDVRCVSSVPDFGFCLRLDLLLKENGSLGEFLNKRNLCDDESCCCGEAVEDFQHVLCSCPLYEDIRNLVEM